MNTYYFYQHDSGGRIIEVNYCKAIDRATAFQKAEKRAKEIYSHGITTTNRVSKDLQAFIKAI